MHPPGSARDRKPVAGPAVGSATGFVCADWPRPSVLSGTPGRLRAAGRGEQFASLIPAARTPIATRQSSRVLPLKESDELLAHRATQIPRLAQSRGAYRGAELEPSLFRVRDLQLRDLAVPRRIVLNNVRELLAHPLNRRRVVRMD